MPVQDIYSGNALIQPKSIQDFDNENLLMQQKRQGLQAASLANQESAMNLQKNQSILAQRQGLAQTLQSGQVDLGNTDHQANLVAQFPDVAPGFLKTVQDSKTAAAAAQKDAGAGAKSQADATNTALATARGALSLVQTPQAMAQWMHGLYASPQTASLAQQIGGSEADAVARIPTDPKDFQIFLLKNQLGMDDYTKNQTTQRGQDLELQGHKIQAGATMGAAQISANASTANNAANNTREYRMNGMDPKTGQFVGFSMPPAAVPGASGVPGAGAPAGPVAPGAPAGAQPAAGAPVAAAAPANPMSGVVDAIGKYVAPEGVALQRFPPALKGAVLAAVMEKYPDYNAANFGGVSKTVGSMAAGPLGAAVRSNNVALTHLDTLGQLASAMSNGDIPLVNKVRNMYQTQTGQTAPTNLAAARQLVMGEVANVVAAGASTEADRKQAQAAVDSAASPAQLSEAINKVIKPLMAGKLQGLETQYNAGTAGTRSDFRSKYLSPAAKASLDAVAPMISDAQHPPEITSLLQKYGAK